MNLRERLQRMLQIVEESERIGALSDIERDILLAELREAYAELKFGVESGVPRVENEKPAVVELPVAPTAPIEEVEEEVEEKSDEPEVEVELVFDEDDDEEIEDSSEELGESSEKIEENLSTPDSRLSTVESAVAAESAVENEEFSILNPQSSINKRSALLSLYEDNPTPVLGEQFHEAPSVADTIACPKGVAESAPVASLREAIGVADKFMLVRELFGGDADAYEVAIDALEAQPSFDDCIIYIAEHYAWSPNSQATKLIMELLNRKYNA